MSALPVEPTEERPVAVTIGGERAVLWTDETGVRRAARDMCPHRRAPLSEGTVVDGRLVCPYHGWAFAGDGTCASIPALGEGARIPARACLDVRPAPDLGREAPVGRLPDAEPGRSTSIDWLDGDTPGLDRFWHPVARRTEVAGDGTVVAELLGERWLVDVRAGRATTLGPHGGRTAWGVRAHLGHVWVAPDEPLVALPEVAEWGEPGWYHRAMPRAEGRYGAGLLVDNQLDAAHFPFLHAGTFGTPAGAALPDAEVEAGATWVTSTMRVPITAANDHRAAPPARSAQQHRTMHYRWEGPFWLRLRLDYEEMGGSTTILFSVTPLAAGRARMDVDLLFRHPEDFSQAQLDDRVAFETRVVGEDLWLQARFEDLRLPLAPSAELHTRADKLSVQSRRVLRRLLEVATSPT